jgi:hypothetical protein
MWWLPLLLLVALLVMTTAEKFTEPGGSFAAVTRPDKSTLWTGKIAANTPFGTEPDAYTTALAAFYDSVYVPAADRPKEAAVDTFVKLPHPGTDPAVLKTIIMEAFHIDGGKKDESKQTAFEPSAVLLAPKDGVDEVRTRTEDEYAPTDTTGPFNETPMGELAPTPQTIPSRGERRKRELTPIENS